MTEYQKLCAARDELREAIALLLEAGLFQAAFLIVSSKDYETLCAKVEYYEK